MALLPPSSRRNLPNLSCTIIDTLWPTWEYRSQTLDHHRLLVANLAIQIKDIRPSQTPCGQPGSDTDHRHQTTIDTLWPTWQYRSQTLDHHRHIVANLAIQVIDIRPPQTPCGQPGNTDHRHKPSQTPCGQPGNTDHRHQTIDTLWLTWQ